MSVDNRIDIHVFDRDYTLEASLGASTIYKNQFKGAVNEPFLGNLVEDIFKLYAMVESPEHAEGIDFDILFGLMWAMGKAAGSIEETWEQFYEQVAHKPLTFEEVSGVYSVIVHELGDGVIFRLPDRPSDDTEPDAEQEEEQ